MENASKALLIAGAILIAILIIAIGMLVYNSAKGSIDSGLSQMDTNEIQAHNAQFTDYEGKQKGTSVKMLFSKVASNNGTYANDTQRIVQIYYPNNLVDTSGTNGWIQLPSNLQKASSLIETNKTYTVTMERNDSGLISKITIK